jgi:hypothetical protein
MADFDTIDRVLLYLCALLMAAPLAVVSTWIF